jgi:hypothetical protein
LISLIDDDQALTVPPLSREEAVAKAINDMKKPTYRDVVRVRSNAPAEYRPGSTGSVIGITRNYKKLKYKNFPPGTVYLVEFDNGEAIDIPEIFLG